MATSDSTSTTSSASGLPARRDVLAASGLLEGRVRRTPVIDVACDDLGVARSGSLALKLELLQHSGSFKARGALHALLHAPPGAQHVITASGGNHGAAVAWAAAQLGFRADIFVPVIAAPAKVEVLRRFGARVHQVGADYAASLAASQELSEGMTAVSVHAYDQHEVMCGAGTVGLELAEQVPGVDVVVVACGGGGLAGGIAAALGGQADIVVVETSLTPAYAAAVSAGEPVDVEVGGVGADALGAPRVGDLAWAVLQQHGARSVLVDDARVLEAQRGLWDELRLRVEPAAAAALAALRDPEVAADLALGDARVAVVVCGANVS